MSQHEYITPLFIHEDGTLAVHGGNIRGLIVETDTLDEMRSELLRITPRLLRSNHGLTDEEIEHASLRLVPRSMVGAEGAEGAEGAVEPAPKSHTPQSPQLLWEDNPRIMTMVCA